MLNMRVENCIAVCVCACVCFISVCRLLAVPVLFGFEICHNGICNIGKVVRTRSCFMLVNAKKPRCFELIVVGEIDGGGGAKDIEIHAVTQLFHYIVSYCIVLFRC